MSRRLLFLGSALCAAFFCVSCANETETVTVPADNGDVGGWVSFTIDVTGTLGITPTAGTAVSESVFRPALQFAPSPDAPELAVTPATVTIEYGDGSALRVTVSASSWQAPVHRYAVSSAPVTARLRVEPSTALTVINTGFRAGDGGNDQSGKTDVPFIAYLPPLEAPFGDSGDALDARTVRAYVGTVLAVDNLQAYPNLHAFCCEWQPLRELDLSGLASLRTLEAFYSEIKKTNFQGCAALRRCCLESTGAYASWRVEGGVRIESEELDLRDSPLLQDIRGTNDDHVRVRLSSAAKGSLWHFCKMNNGRMRDIAFDDGGAESFDLSDFTALTQCWVSGTPLFGESVLIGNGVTESLWAGGCGIREIRAAGQGQLTELDLSFSGAIDLLDIGGCAGLTRLNLANDQLAGLAIGDSARLVCLNLTDCGLSQDLVDSLLVTLDSFLTVADYSWLSEEERTDPLKMPVCLASTANAGRPNAPPSSAGLAHLASLRSRGWVISTN